MNNIKIFRPNIEDIQKINEFFELVLRDTFRKNHIENLQDLLAEEIECKKEFLAEDFKSNGEKIFFLIAKEGENIIGTVQYGPSNEVIVSASKEKLKNVKEIGTVFVHPEYQGKGIGSKILETIFQSMLKDGIEEFCMDSGYKSAQKIWTNKFGKPEYLLKDYWGEDGDHMIWYKNIKDFIC